MSAASIAEAGIVLDMRRPGAFDSFRHALNIEVICVDAEQADLARGAYLRFGKGSGHAAQLNFGDCFAYAASVANAEPLLFLGNDYSETDVLGH